MRKYSAANLLRLGLVGQLLKLEQLARPQLAKNRMFYRSVRVAVALLHSQTKAVQASLKLR